jgi:hypothetical protein
MRQIAHYAVLKFQPYPNRTEHVNYGLVVFMPHGGAEVFIPSRMRKVRAMFPLADIRSLQEQEETIPELLSDMPLEDAVSMLNAVSVLHDQEIAQLGKFEYTDRRDFIRNVQMALGSQVEASARPKKERESRNKLFTDVRSTFKQIGILAPPGEHIPDHQVVENYVPDPEADVKVEFALQNGQLRLAQTVDLRAETVGLSSTTKAGAYSKAFAMDYASKVLLNSGLKTYVIVAGTETDAAQKIISALQRTTDEVLSWESPSDMQFFFDEWEIASRDQTGATFS